MADKQLRDAMVEVGKEKAPTAPDESTVIFALDSATDEMKPIVAEDLPVSTAQATAIEEVNDKAEAAAAVLEADITVTVGAGGDYATINAALEFLTKKYPIYKSGGITATINLLTGFVMNEQVIVKGVDLGWITITGADTATLVASESIVSPTDPLDDDGKTTIVYAAFYGDSHAVLPTINQSFTLDTGHKCFLALNRTSKAVITSGVTVTGFGVILYVSKVSMLIASSVVLVGDGTAGVLVSSGSTVDVRASTISTVSHGIKAISSTVEFSKGAIVGATVFAMDAQNSKANCDSASVDYELYGLASQRGSIVNAADVTFTGSAAQPGNYVSEGSVINANGNDGSVSQSVNTLFATGVIYK